MSQTACKAINGAMTKANINAQQLAGRTGIPQQRLDNILAGSETATDDEFKKLSSTLSLPEPSHSGVHQTV